MLVAELSGCLQNGSRMWQKFCKQIGNITLLPTLGYLVFAEWQQNVAGILRQMAIFLLPTLVVTSSCSSALSYTWQDAAGPAHR